MKKLIPPTLFVLCISGMLALKYITPDHTIVMYPYNLAGILFLIGGLGLTATVRKHFDKVNTEIHTFKAPGKMVKKGVFKYSRNPIYLGFVLALVGIWIVLNNSSAGIPVVAFFLAANFWYIPYEEKQMRSKFGKEYEDYQSKVRRWI